MLANVDENVLWLYIAMTNVESMKMLQPCDQASHSTAREVFFPSTPRDDLVKQLATATELC